MNTVIRTTSLVAGLIFLLSFSNLSLASGLTSVVDRTNIEMDESITLKVIFDAFQAQGEPDFSHLTQNFDVASNNRSSQQSIINGKVTASTEWRMTLFPKTAGQLLIPPFSFQGYASQPISINVTKGHTTTSADIKPDIFLETEIDKSELYVQEQAIVTFRLFFNRSVNSLDAEEIKQPNLRTEELPRADYQKTVGNRTYGVAEFRYALIADASGNISIPAKTWTVESTDRAGNRFFNGGRRKLHRVKTKAIELNVKPKPDDYPITEPWLPASNLQLSEKWSQDPTSFKLGEPITRTVMIQAEGVAAEQLPPIFNDGDLADFKFYPDKPNQENQTSGSGLSGTRTESVAIVPTRSGDLTLPEISVTWWDTKTQSIQKATLAEVTVNIPEPISAGNDTTQIENHSLLPSPAQASPPVVVKTPTLWLIIAALSITLNVALAGFLYWTISNRRQPSANQTSQSPNMSVKQAFRSVEDACSSKDPAKLRSSLLAWADLHWQNHQIKGLKDIGNLSQNDRISSELDTLNGVLFSQKTDTIDYSKLLELLQKLPEVSTPNHSKSALKPLYGT